MANSTYGSAVQQVMGNMVTNTTTTAGISGLAGIGSVTAPPPRVFPWDEMRGLVGVFRVRKLENGYVVEGCIRLGEVPREYFAETLKDVGERICALGVQKAVEGEKKP